MQLYPHQAELIDAARNSLRSNRRIILCSPVGSGKTAMASFMLKSALERGKRIIFSVPRISLLHQTSNTFDEIGIPHGYIWAERDYDPSLMCHIASVDTLYRRLDKVIKPDFLVLDETKHAPSKSWRKIVEWMDGYIVGLDATPTRTGKEGFEGLFDDIVCGKSVRWLIDNGYLSDYRIFAPPAIDRSALHTKAGEFIAEEVAAQALVGNPVEHWRKFAEGKRSIMFAPTVASSIDLVAKFNAAGIPAAHMDADTPVEERIRLINLLADGELMVISNVGLFIEGFDMAATVGREVTIECVIFYTATKSLAKWLQSCGRGMRRKDTPCIIIDCGGNCLALGMPDEEHKWTLAGVEKQEITKVVQCKRCFFCYSKVGACPECGAVPVVKKRKPVKMTAGELVEITPHILYESDCRTLQDWHILAKKIGKKPGWAYMRWKQRRWQPNLSQS